MSQSSSIRFANPSDLKYIVDIYNQAIQNGNATADLEVITIDQKTEWFSKHDMDNYPIYVMEVDEKIIGWGSLSSYREGRGALRPTAEISYYLDYRFHGKGYGTKLIEHIITDCSRLRIKNLFAILLDVNTGSIIILERFGFNKWGHMPSVANLNGLVCGHVIYGKNLSSADNDNS